MGGSPGELSEELVTQERRKKGWRMNCDVGEEKEGLENEIQHFRHFTYITTHSPTFPSLHLRHGSFSQSFRHFTYVTAQSPTLPFLHLRHSSFSNPYFASPTSQALHLLYLASRPCIKVILYDFIS